MLAEGFSYGAAKVLPPRSDHWETLGPASVTAESDPLFCLPFTVEGLWRLDSCLIGQRCSLTSILSHALEFRLL